MQFLVYMFQAAYNILANIIDDGFANRMSINAVVAYGSFLPLTWVVHSACHIGKYAYTAIHDFKKSCLALGLIVSCISIVVGLMVTPIFRVVYNLTDVQYDMLDKLFIAFLFTVPFRVIGSFVETYLLINSQNKIVIRADVVYWVVALSLDVIVFIKGMEVYWLAITTGVAYFVFDILLLVQSDVLDDKVTIHGIKIAFVKGKDIVVIDRLLGKVATLFYGAVASRLPSEAYAVHCICYGIICNMETFTNYFNTFVVSKLYNVTRRFKEYTLMIIRKYCVRLWTLEFGFSIILLLFYHGKVDFWNCFGWLFLYAAQCFSLVFYEGFKATLNRMSRTEYLRYGGLIGICTRIPCLIIASALGFRMLGLATSCIVDFGCRAIYFWVMINKREPKNVFSESID